MADTPDLDSLRAIMAKRTPGDIEIAVHPDGGWQIWIDEWIATFEKEEDAKAFVAAVNAIGPLMERVRELEKENERMRELIHNASNHAAGW